MKRSIRRARADDLPALNRIMFGSRAYAGDYQRILEGYDITPAYLDAYVVCLEEEGERVVGFYGLDLRAGAELDLLFVDDGNQGQGVGERLFTHMAMTAEMHGAKSVTIGSHPPAMGFYERQGAVRIGEHPPDGRITWARPILRLDLPRPMRR